MGLVNGLGVLIAIGSGLMLGGFVISLMDGTFSPGLLVGTCLGGAIASVLVKYG